MSASKFDPDRSVSVTSFCSKLEILRQSQARDLVRDLTLEAFILASKGQASDVIRIIFEAFESQKFPRLAILYLLDSIAKKPQENILKNKVQTILSDMFIKSFKSEANQRNDLYKLRVSWKNVFDLDFLDNLDVKILMIDENWPICSDNAKRTFNEKKYKNPIRNDVILNNSNKRGPLINHMRYNDQNNSKRPLLDTPSIPKATLQANNYRFVQKNNEFINHNFGSAYQKLGSHLKLVLDYHNSVNECFEVFLGNRSYFFKIGSVSRKVKHFNTYYKIFINNSYCLEIDDVSVYKACSQPSQYNQMNVFFRSHPFTLYIDGRPIFLHHTAPPYSVIENGHEHLFQVVDFRLIVDGNYVCELFTGDKYLELFGKRCTISFFRPPEKIVVNGSDCDVYFDGYFPFVQVNNRKMLALFQGPPAFVRINQETYRVNLGDVTYITLNKKRVSLAIGGPFFELIVDGVCYGIFFGGNLIDIKIGHMEYKVSLLDPSPKIDHTILDEVFAKMIPKKAFNDWPPPFYQPEPKLIPNIQPKTPKIDLQNLTNLDYYANIINSLTSSGILNNQKIDNQSSMLQEEPLKDLSELEAVDLKQFYKNNLKKLFLYIQCPICGIRYPDEKNEVYQKHLDWHYFINNKLNKKIGSKVKVCQVFYSIPEWIHYHASSSIDLEKNNDELEENSSVFNIQSKSPTSSQINNKNNDIVIGIDLEEADFCEACGDQFEHKWDQQKEAWIVKNCIVKNDK
ncbi:MAG: mRNA 3' end processing factor, partial [Paramarteilia canceri]